MVHALRDRLINDCWSIIDDEHICFALFYYRDVSFLQLQKLFKYTSVPTLLAYNAHEGDKAITQLTEAIQPQISCS